jgi:DNA-binding LacI/PurR family transcriptional regulator
VKVIYKHREIYRTLVAEIADGRYDAAQRLPSEAQLVRRFGVSRPTAARALRDLQSEGIVERRVGAGSFLVKDAKAPYADASRQLGVLLPALEVSEILDVVCAELAGLTRANDYSLLWANSKQPSDLTVKDAEEVCQHFIDRSVRGVFFAPFEFASDKDQVSKRTAEQLKRAGIAVVLLDRDLVPFSLRSDFDLVGIDNVMAGYMACEHLIKLGVRRIAFVGRPLSAPTVTARVAGAREAMIDAGLEPRKGFYRIGDPRDAAFVQELTIGRKIEGIICANDFTAAQLMHSFAKVKIRVPEDLRLIGFDNLKYAELLAVPLTTISQPYREIARNALRAMLGRLADPTLPATSLLSSPRLVVRTSCGAFMPR